MKVVISTLWIRRDGEEYEESPELAEAWTEFDIEGYPEGWEKAKADALKAYGDDLLDWREIDIPIDYDEVRACFMPARISAASITQRSGDES